jgi:hypothetical protein
MMFPFAFFSCFLWFFWLGGSSPRRLDQLRHPPVERTTMARTMHDASKKDKATVAPPCAEVTRAASAA